MTRVISVMEFVVSDRFIFPFSQVLFIDVFMYALNKRMRLIKRILEKLGGPKRGSEATAIVKRGPGSWQRLYLFFGFASVALMQLINISESLKGYKVIIGVIDLASLIYLVFFNAWFRNKVIGLISRSQEMEERY